MPKAVLLLFCGLISLCLLFPARCLFADQTKINIFFTGQTHSSLYHCNCPVEPDGGVARRLTKIKELRAKYPDCLILDSGNIFASGILDENSQAKNLDKKRTISYLKALNLMGYDFIAIGEDEFCLGEDFLIQALKNTDAKFLSCNIKADKVSPFLIKKLYGVKLAIVGLTHFTKKSNSFKEIQVLDEKESLKDALNTIKKENVDLIILLSQVPEEDCEKLAKENPDINIIISGKGFLDSPLSKLVSSTLIIRPARNGRRIGEINLTLEKGVVRYPTCASEIRVSGEIADDPQVAAMIPRCFRDEDCFKKSFSLFGLCKNPGEKDAECIFKEVADLRK